MRYFELNEIYLQCQKNPIKKKKDKKETETKNDVAGDGKETKNDVAGDGKEKSE